MFMKSRVLHLIGKTLALRFSIHAFVVRHYPPACTSCLLHMITVTRPSPFIAAAFRVLHRGGLGTRLALVECKLISSSSLYVHMAKKTGLDEDINQQHACES